MILSSGPLPFVSVSFLQTVPQSSLGADEEEGIFPASVLSIGCSFLLFFICMQAGVRGEGRDRND